MYDEWLYLFHNNGFVIFQAHKPDFPFLVLFDEWLNDFFSCIKIIFLTDEGSNWSFKLQ